MSTFKRVALIATVASSAVVTVLFALILWHPGGAGLAGALRDMPILLGLASLVALMALCGVVAGVVRVVRTFTHVAARLSANDSGSISIEKSALVSVAQGALARVPNLTVQNIEVDVVPKRSGAVLDVEVLASPLGTDSLMTLAQGMQGAVKRALEAFTEHEVRYVSVKFVESRRRGESLSADAKAAAGEPKERKIEAKLDPEMVRAAEEQDEFEEEPAKPSLWSRAKARAGKLRSRVDGDDAPIMTAAVVTDAGEAPAPADGQPEPSVDAAVPATSESSGSADAHDAAERVAASDEPCAPAKPEILSSEGAQKDGPTPAAPAGGADDDHAR